MARGMTTLSDPATPGPGPGLGRAPLPPLNAPQAHLRPQALPPRPLTGAEVVPGLRLSADPAAAMTGTWSSPRGRLLEIETTVTTPGAWFALRLTLPPIDLTGLAWLGFVLRSGAGHGVGSRACLRSGLAGGAHHDLFFDRLILSQPGESDHHDLIAPDRCPGLPLHAPWREFLLFLPPAEDLRIALHDLRLFAV